MAKRIESPQKAAMREMMREYLKNNDISIKSGTEVNAVMRDMMSVLLEVALDEELHMFLLFSTHNYAIIVLKKGVKHYAYYYAY